MDVGKTVKKETDGKSTNLWFDQEDVEAPEWQDAVESYGLAAVALETLAEETAGQAVEEYESAGKAGVRRWFERSVRSISFDKDDKPVALKLTPGTVVLGDEDETAEALDEKAAEEGAEEAASEVSAGSSRATILRSVDLAGRGAVEVEYVLKRDKDGEVYSSMKHLVALPNEVVLVLSLVATEIDQEAEANEAAEKSGN